MFKKRQSDIRVQKSRVPHVSALPRTKIREIGEIRVPNKNIRFIRVVRVQKTVSVATRTKIREIGEIRVQDKNIRVIRVITSLRSVGLRRISCSKEYIKGYALN